MGTDAQKKKLYSGLSPEEARVKLLEIWNEKKSGRAFEDIYPDVWPWMEAWHSLRLHSWSVDAMIQAFAEKLAKLNAQKRKLEIKLGEQKKQILAMQRVLEKRSTTVPPATSSTTDSTVADGARKE